MTGIYGGTVTDSSLTEIGDLLEHREWHGREQLEGSSLGLGIVHHNTEDAGYEVVTTDGNRGGVIYGGVGNLDAFGDATALIERILKDPPATLAEMDGPCAIAAYDATDERFIAATDKVTSSAP